MRMASFVSQLLNSAYNPLAPKVSIGVFSLAGGNSFEIVLSDNANGIVISDAFKFEFIGDENMDKEP